MDRASASVESVTQGPDSHALGEPRCRASRGDSQADDQRDVLRAGPASPSWPAPWISGSRTTPRRT